ncbi:MAG: HlyD family secretion protein, partial [Acidobacteriota bacterium]
MGAEAAGRGTWRPTLALALNCALWLGACGHDDRGRDAQDPGPADGSWQITIWGSSFEIYPEIGALALGGAARAHVHVTQLDDFSPVTSGAVEIVFSSPAGEEVFRSEAPSRPGLFDIDVTPSSLGEFDLSFRIETPAASEEIRGGRVRVGDRNQPGGVIVAPAPKGGNGGEPLPFLKEEQWRSAFATSWVRRGELPRSLHALVRVRPPAGGERVITSPLAGVAGAPGAWPFPGQRISGGAPLFHVKPLVAVDRSLAELEAAASGLDIEQTAVRQRLSRLEELLELDATSRREVEEVRHHAEILETRYAAAASDLEAARSARSGGGSGSLVLEAPFDGEVAEVRATPGATVAAGDALARVVRTDAVWLEAALSPADAAQLTPGQDPRGLLVTPPGGRRTIEISDARLVSVAPEAAARTGKIAAYFEVATSGAAAPGVDGGDAAAPR